MIGYVQRVVYALVNGGSLDIVGGNPPFSINCFFYESYAVDLKSRVRVGARSAC